MHFGSHKVLFIQLIGTCVVWTGGRGCRLLLPLLCWHSSHDVIYYCHQQLERGIVWNRVGSHSTSAFFSVLFAFNCRSLPFALVGCGVSKMYHVPPMERMFVSLCTCWWNINASLSPLVNQATRCLLMICFSGWNWNSKIWIRRIMVQQKHL